MKLFGNFNASFKESKNTIEIGFQIFKLKFQFIINISKVEGSR